MLQRLIEDVLDFSRLEVGALQFRNEAFSLGDVCRRVLDVYAGPAREKGLSLTLHLPHGVEDPLEGDPLRIQQVITNLVGNAVKYTDAGEVRFGVGPRRPHGHILIWVEDTGPGIPLDRLGRIFDRFETGVMSDGIGLGLNIVQLLVARMNGTVRCVARTGPGARFEVSLPLSAPAHAEPAKARYADGAVERVLVVDDTAVVRSVAEDMLKTVGCTARHRELGSGGDSPAGRWSALRSDPDGLSDARYVWLRNITPDHPWPELKGRLWPCLRTRQRVTERTFRMPA